jgi:hypothetical protein
VTLCRVPEANDFGTPVAIGCAPHHALAGDICASFWHPVRIPIYHPSLTIRSNNLTQLGYRETPAERMSHRKLVPKDGLSSD